MAQKPNHFLQIQRMFLSQFHFQFECLRNQIRTAQITNLESINKAKANTGNFITLYIYIMTGQRCDTNKQTRENTKQE